MRKVWILAGGLAVALVLGLWLAFRESSHTAVPEGPEAVPAVERVAPRAGRPEEPPRPADVEVTGLVLDGALRRRPGVELVLGEERTVSQGDGSFRFPEGPRPAHADLLVTVDGQEVLRFRGVYTGGAERPGELPPGEPAGLFPTYPAARPASIRWTLNLVELNLVEDGAERPAAGGPDPGDAEPKASAREGLPRPARVLGVLAEEWGRAGLVRIAGTSSLPEGAHLDAVLYLEGERAVASVERAEVRESRFQGRILFPVDQQVHSALYSLRLTFAGALEDPRDVERWRAERPDIPWDGTDALETSLEIFVGDPTDEEEETGRIEAYYRETLDAAESLRRMILAWSARARQLSAGWDPALLKARAANAEAWFGGPLVDASGTLDLESWRRFLDRGFRPETLDLLQRHRERTHIKYRSAEGLLQAVLTRLLLLSRIESVMLYQSLGLDIHPNDFFLDSEMPEGDRTILLDMLDLELKALQPFRNLRRGAVKAAAERPSGAGEKATDPPAQPETEKE